jgi:putative transposase
LVLCVLVHSAGLQDDEPEAVGQLFLRMVLKGWSRLKVIWADGMYEGQAILWANAIGGWMLRIVHRTPGVRGFQLLPRRWVVERTFAWLGRYRRLSKDYEFHCHNSETMILLAMINLMSKRLKTTS